jgi:hypothetical protein
MVSNRARQFMGVLISRMTREAPVRTEPHPTSAGSRVASIVTLSLADTPTRFHRVAMIEEINGCPHEEGVDYALGEVCPECKEQGVPNDSKARSALAILKAERNG